MSKYKVLLKSSMFLLKDMYVNIIPYKWLHKVIIIGLSILIILWVFTTLFVLLTFFIIDHSSQSMDDINLQQVLFYIENYINISLYYKLMLLNGIGSSWITLFILIYYFRYRFHLYNLHLLLPHTPTHTIAILLTPFIVSHLFIVLCMYMPMILISFYFHPILTTFGLLNTLIMYIWGINFTLYLFYIQIKTSTQLRNYSDLLKRTSIFLLVCSMLITILFYIDTRITFIDIDLEINTMLMFVFSIISVFLLPITLKKTCDGLIRQLIDKATKLPDATKKDDLNTEKDTSFIWGSYHPWHIIKRYMSLKWYIIGLIIGYIFLRISKSITPHIIEYLPFPSQNSNIYYGLASIIIIMGSGHLLSMIMDIEKKQAYRALMAPYNYRLKYHLILKICPTILLITTIMAISIDYRNLIWIMVIVLSSMVYISIIISQIGLKKPFLEKNS